MIHMMSVQLDVIPGDVRQNWKNIQEEIAKAEQSRADILILPEMCLSGYLIGDLWDQNSFLRECELYGEKIIRASKNLSIIFGNVAVDWKKTNDDGRPRKYNAAFVASGGHLVTRPDIPFPYAVKVLLPNYRQFDDKRYFTGLSELSREENLSPEKLMSPFTIPAGDEILKAGILLCEDSWDENYPLRPMEIISACRPEMLINISASPFTLGKEQKRHRIFSAASSRFHLPILYVNQRGLQNNGKDCYTFDGMTAAYGPDGILKRESPPYTEPRSSFLFTRESGCLCPCRTGTDAGSSSSMTLTALRYGVNKFLSAIGAERVVIGISGGIDSAVGAALYRSVLPPGQVLLVNTPTRFNSETTKNLAGELASRLQCPYIISPIGSFIDQTEQELQRLMDIYPGMSRKGTGVIKENIQARDRSSRILAGLSASFGGIFTCNANKTELSAGYATLYGDMSGALAATADLWKHQIYQLGRELNQWFPSPVIPDGIFALKPSAELSDSQNVDHNEGDPFIYDYHDYLFRSFIEPWERKTPEDILSWYMENTLEEHIGTPLSVHSLFPSPRSFIDDLEHWWNLFSGFAVAKRIQCPPLIAVSRRPYGFDLRESQLRPYYTEAYLDMKRKILNSDSREFR
ncbi:MAG TPA: NAD(+) synthase [Veillonellaceae bacterium]|nr:NAD(+) synthase [Veillonellaceae bacterium]